MYEHLRNAFIAELPMIDASTLNKVVRVLDKVAADYDITEKQTALAVVDDMPQTVKLFLASKKLEGLSDDTIRFYACRLRLFFEHVRKDTIDVQANDIRLFLVAYQAQTKISDRTLEKFRQILNGFFKWCLNEEYITKNPCNNIKEIKYEVVPRRALTRFQLERLRRACKSKRDLAIIDVLYSTGCRVRELVNMSFDDYDGETIKIVGKGKKHNIVYLNTNAQISLREYLATRTDSNPYLFVSDRKPHDQLSVRGVQRRVEILGESINIKLSPHILRHTSATLALQNGMPITQVQKMLGHSSVNTTQIYAETSQEAVAISHKRYVI